ncbi:hypothetical protein A3A67_03670 [Candidatus Peribacteria bacterium RIFCSPLOWO2_01_FULL_51_18]|nr:MAG: hypothetical protein A3C52_02250 [Candidatus Peribacteria bacterium RIFCSPHIGHO2_02_FULL_51_15]OGJ65936.1 MAG: hypothetical protein A3A67_03670 [Candidatus Peribacteria bacterium RIFCSPLOWO2_01_FULL_51_18]OGJ68960.1 MAG: hypothetical protein A3J34_01790 [Candidatus Peribacteria bacterium RIFCSPLOWO2_02_FULL_51_10]
MPHALVTSPKRDNNANLSMARTIELDDYRRRSREGLTAMRMLLQEMVDAFPEGKKPANIIRILAGNTHDDALSVFGMCLGVEKDEVLSPASHASCNVHSDMNKLSGFIITAESCPDYHLVSELRSATRQLQRLVYRNAPSHLLQ